MMMMTVTFPLLQENDFYSLWNQARITWRKNNPYNKVSINNEKKIKFISPSILSFIQVFSYLPNDNTSIVFDKKKFNFFLPHLFIGLIPKKNNKNFFFKVPNFLKPSPLNFLYKDISGKNSIIDVKKCFFSYLDFDAY